MRKGRRAIQKPAIAISSLISCAMQNPTPAPLAAALAALRSRERDFDLFRLPVKDFSSSTPSNAAFGKPDFVGNNWYGGVPYIIFRKSCVFMDVSVCFPICALTGINNHSHKTGNSGPPTPTTNPLSCHAVNGWSSSDATCGARQALQLACQPLGGCRASAMRSARAAALADGPNPTTAARRRWRDRGLVPQWHLPSRLSDSLTEISLTGCLLSIVCSYRTVQPAAPSRSK